MAEQFLHSLRLDTRTVERTRNRPGARSGDAVNRDSFALEHLQDADMRDPARYPSAERQAYTLTLNRGYPVSDHSVGLHALHWTNSSEGTPSDVMLNILSLSMTWR
jgi:hypothetical protein